MDSENFKVVNEMQKNTLALKNDIYWVGVNDYDLRVFDIVMATEFGTSYNSYIVKGKEKTALIDTAKANFTEDFMAKVSSLIEVERIDYLILNHTEPDHSGAVIRLIEQHPEITVIATSPGLANLKEILNRPFKSLRATDQLTIDLGGKTLSFMILPNLHWPDTMFTYLKEDNVLFTCDFFGSHYAFEGVYAAKVPSKTDFVSAFENYFFSIMLPFKPFVVKALDRIEHLELNLIMTSHGPIIDQTFMKEAFSLYRQWSKPNLKHDIPLIVIPLASAYGYTAKIAEAISQGMRDQMKEAVQIEILDVVDNDPDIIVARIRAADAFLIGTTTILKDAPKPIWLILSELNPEIDGRKKATAFGSYGWSGEGVSNVLERLKQLKMVVKDGLRVRFNPSQDQLQEAYDFGRDFAQFLDS